MEIEISSTVLEQKLREQLDDEYTYKHIRYHIDSLSIDFLREANRHEVKNILFYSKSWYTGETIEQHMKRYFPHLKEFWKEMLDEEEYTRKRT